MKLVDLLWSYLEEENEEDSIKSSIDSDPKIPDNLKPKAFLQRYNILNLPTVSITYSYDLSQYNKGLGTLETAIANTTGDAKQKSLKSNNVLQFIKDFENQINEFANKISGVTLKINYTWIYNDNPYTIELSAKKEKPSDDVKDIKILSINNYTKKSTKLPVEPIQKFISLQNQYIHNSPINLLASIIIYNDWNYDWNFKKMQKDLPSRMLSNSKIKNLEKNRYV